MALNRVDLGIQYFPQFAADRAIANAQIYIGQPNLDPAVLANQIQAYVVQENGTQVPVPQPIRTGAGGVPTYNGSPVQIGVSEAQYSLKVLSSTGSQIYYQPDNTDLAIVNAAQVTYNPAGTGAVATTVDAVLNNICYGESFGLVGDDLTDNSTAFTNLNAELEANRYAWLVMPEGKFRTNVGLVNRRGLNVVCKGQCIIRPTGTDRGYLLGGREALPDLAVDIAAGDRIFEFVSPPDVSEGDIISLQSGLSTNSTLPNNVIPLYKDWLRVESVSGNEVTCSDGTKYAHLAADYFSANKILGVGGVTQGLKIFPVLGSFSGPYTWEIQGAYNHKLLQFDGQRSPSFVGSSDQIFFEQSTLQGFGSGASSARGTGRIYYNKSTIRVGPTSGSDRSFFIEETPDQIISEDCDLFGRIECASSTDGTPPKKFIGRKCRIYSAGRALRQRGFYNADSPAVDLEACTFYAPGELGAAGVKTVIDVSFADSTRVVNCDFATIAADSYTVSLASVGAFALEFYGNKGTSGSLGLHSSVTAGRSVVMDFNKSLLQSIGLKFPATQEPSTDVNTLDDYEEGVFTPTLTTDGVDFDSVTYRSQRAGTYTKIGRVVHFQINMETSTVVKTSATGNVCIGGLPFAAQANASGQLRGLSAVAVTRSSNWTETPSSGEINAGETRIKLRKRATSVSSDTYVQVTDVTSGTSNNFVVLTGTYLAAN